jgi:hypothetical protein
MPRFFRICLIPVLLAGITVDQSRCSAATLDFSDGTEVINFNAKIHGLPTLNANPLLVDFPAGEYSVELTNPSLDSRLPLRPGLSRLATPAHGTPCGAPMMTMPFS